MSNERPANAMVLVVVLTLGFAGTTPAQDLKVYFGNLHSHTSYSDGSGKPADAYKYARDVAHLDFLAITEHNHAQAEQGAASDRRDGILIANDHSLYNGTSSTSLISAAHQYNHDGTFVAIFGQEFSSISKGNHINVYELPDVIEVPNGEFDQLFGSWLTSHPAMDNLPTIVQFNHPRNRTEYPNEYGLDDYASEADWIAAVSPYVSLIELLNGPGTKPTLGNDHPEFYESDYLTYLSIGLQLAPTADQDNHYKTWGTLTNVRTGVIADALTKTKILQALRDRHVYATEDKNLRVIFKVNTALTGDRVATPPPVNSDLNIEYSIVDDDEPGASYTIQVFTGSPGNGLAHETNVVHKDGNTVTGTMDHIGDVKYMGGAEYVFFKITQTNEDGPDDRCWTSPVWFETSGGGATPVTGGTEVASRNSAVYHVSLQCRDAQQIKESNRVFGDDAKSGRRLHQGCPR